MEMIVDSYGIIQVSELMILQAFSACHETLGAPSVLCYYL